MPHTHILSAVFLTRIEKIDPATITAALSPEFEQLATAFFNGEQVPENFDTPQNGAHAISGSAAEPAINNVDYKINYFTLWGRLVETQWLLQPVLSTFLVDVIMANEMEQSVLSSRDYFEVKVNRHPKYSEFRETIELAQDVYTRIGKFLDPPVDEEADPDNDYIRTNTPEPEPLTASELPELANPTKPQPLKLSERAKKKKKTKAKAPTKTKSAPEDSVEDSVLVTTTLEDTRIHPGSATENSPKSQPVPSPVPENSVTSSMSTLNPYAKLANLEEEDVGPEWKTISNSSQRSKRRNLPKPIPYFSQGASSSADRGHQNYPRASSTQVSFILGHGFFC